MDGLIPVNIARFVQFQLGVSRADFFEQDSFFLRVVAEIYPESPVRKFAGTVFFTKGDALTCHVERPVHELHLHKTFQIKRGIFGKPTALLRKGT